MAKKSVVLQEDSLKRITKSSSIMALAELVWNALDADATRVDITISDELLSEFIEIADNGTGIDYSVAEVYFSQLGGSWKAAKQMTESNRVMHGEKGEGRFKAFSLGRSVTWSTVYKKDGLMKGYTISQSLDEIKSVSFSNVSDVEKEKTGATVKIEDFLENTMRTTGLGSVANVTERLTIIFAPFLIAHGDAEIFVNKAPLDPSVLMDDEPIDLHIDRDGKTAKLKLFLWKNAKDSQMYLCKDSTMLCPYTGALIKKIKAFGQEYSAYLSSSMFGESTVNIADVDPSILDLVEEAIDKMNEVFQQKEDDKKKLVKDKWIADEIYPYEIKPQQELSPTEVAKREVFDIVAVQVQEKIKKFEKGDPDTKKLTFRLLAQALEENPKAIQKILYEVLNLNDEERDMFAELLNKMELSSIIQSAKVVADRLEFICGLETLLDEHRKTFREVDQLHKMLESEVWLFDENFTLSVSDKSLTKVLEGHLNILGKRSDDVVPEDIHGNPKERTDLMLSKAIEVKEGHHEFLIVELKRPSVKIDRDIIGQIEDYAVAISNSPRFDKKRSRWKFVAVSSELAENAYLRMKDNRVFTSNESIEIYVMTWAEIINNAKSRLNFINNELQYVASDEMARKYLTGKHEKFLPSAYLNQK